MSISPEKTKEILCSHGVTTLYHANTVATSLSFLRAGGLLSRGYVEDIKAVQTPQQSDGTDQAFGIYYDIFFDSVDIHQRTRNLNYYGPVTFVYSVEVLDLPGIEVKVTKQNPIYWTQDMDEAAKYFTNEAELEFHYEVGNFQEHITLCNMHTPLPFVPYLQEILLEDPQIANTAYFERAVEALSAELRRQGIVAPLNVRACPDNCGCHAAYKEHKEGYTYHRFKLDM